MPTKHTNIQHAIIRECDSIKQLLLSKNKEYGNSAIQPIRIFSDCDPEEQINVRIDDKLSRICYTSRFGGKISEDTERDLIGYLILKRVHAATCVIKTANTQRMPNKRGKPPKAKAR